MTKVGGGSSSPTIGPEGGTITSTDGRLTLTFPPGALSEDTEITIRNIDPNELPPEFDGLDPDLAYLLEPDGIVFAVPVTATLMLDEEPAQDDGSLSTELALLITSSNGELEVLENLTADVDGDENTTTVSGELGHFSDLVRTDTGITFSVSGVPEIMGVGETFEALVNVDKPGFVDYVIFLVPAPTYTDASIAPIRPVFLPPGGTALLPFIVDDPPRTQTLQEDFTYTCDFPGKGAYLGFVRLRLRKTNQLQGGFKVSVGLTKGITCPGPGPTPTPESCVKDGVYKSSPATNDCGIGEFRVVVRTDGTLGLFDFGENSGEVSFDKTADPNVFQSASMNLLILGKEGHSCTITCGPANNQVTLKCTRTDGAMCTEVFTLEP